VVGVIPLSLPNLILALEVRTDYSMSVTLRDVKGTMDSTTVGFRLKNDVWARYSAEASAQGLPLATHLRRRLEEHASCWVSSPLSAAPSKAPVPMRRLRDLLRRLSPQELSSRSFSSFEPSWGHRRRQSPRRK
jgi:hypothetical protein